MAKRFSPAERRRLEQALKQGPATGVGRPLDGNERKMLVAGKMEPSIVGEIHDLTQRDVLAFAEEMVPVLKRIRDGNDAEAIAAVKELLEAANALGESKSDAA